MAYADEGASRGDRAKAWIKAHFPERQVVLRTEGRVSFIRLSGRVQMAMVGVLVALGGWATFASVNFVIHDQILASKESQIANTRLAYRSLLGEVAEYQKKFNAITSDLEANHGLMLGLVEQNASLQQNLRSIENQLQATEQDRERIIAARERLKSSLGELNSRLNEINSNNYALKENLTTVEDDLHSVVAERNRALEEARQLKESRDQLEARLAELQEMEQGSVRKLAERTNAYMDSMERVIELAGLDVAKVLSADLGLAESQGGPFVEIKPVENDNLPAAELRGDLLSLDARLQRTAALQGVMRKLPLAPPMETYYITGPYGKRRDPLNNRWAMHYGLDLGGPLKSQVLVTAPGVVSYAGWKGNYGKLVEVDHGAGLITRYAHLDKINVKKGQKVEFRDIIGLLGNTGRSTGAHLHYEVSFNGKMLNPMKFIKAGRHVFQE